MKMFFAFRRGILCLVKTGTPLLLGNIWLNPMLPFQISINGLLEYWCHRKLQLNLIQYLRQPYEFRRA